MRKKSQSKYFQISKSEKSITRALASVFALRMIGLFMILPIFSLYANNFKIIIFTNDSIFLLNIVYVKH